MLILYQEADMFVQGSLGPVEDAVGYQLKRAQHRLRLTMDAQLRSLGLTTPQYAVLSALEADAGLSGAELARRAFVTPQTMQGLVVSLERAGFLTRQPHATHGRILRTFLTPAGASALGRAHAVVADIHCTMLAPLSETSRHQLVSLLRTCANQLADAEVTEHARDQQ